LTCSIVVVTQKTIQHHFNIIDTFRVFFTKTVTKFVKSQIDSFSVYYLTSTPALLFQYRRVLFRYANRNKRSCFIHARFRHWRWLVQYPFSCFKKQDCEKWSASNTSPQISFKRCILHGFKVKRRC